MRAISPPSAADAAPPSLRTRKRAYPGLAGALAREAAGRVKDAAEARLYRSRAWRLSLAGPLPAHLAIVPDALASATLEGAQEILRGRFVLAEGVLSVRGQSPFDAEADEPVKAALHRFVWLAHLEKAGGNAARDVARALCEDWLDRFEHWERLSWRPGVLGPRLIAWAAHFRFLTGDHDLLFRSRLMKAMAEETRHLARSIGDAPEGPDRLAAAAALTVMALTLPEAVKRRDRAIAALQLAIDGALLDDGGIVTRNPADQVEAVAALLRVTRALADAGESAPAFLAPALAAATARLNMMRLGDGGLCPFHGGCEGDTALIAELLDGARFAGPGFAPHWGYARLTGHDSTLVFDCGGAPDGAHATGAHAGPLSFVFAEGDRRLIVNSGVARRRGAAWIEAARRTAAHSTLQLGEDDAGHILSDGAAKRLGARLFALHGEGEAASGPDGGWAEGTHDGWGRQGVSHRRRLWLSPAGDDLRGEDSVTRASPRGRLEVAVRFLLHPECRATLAQGGDSIILAPPGGDPWRFRAALTGPDERLMLEEAVYMAGETVRRTEAIVVRAGITGSNWTLRWALKAEIPGQRPRHRLV